MSSFPLDASIMNPSFILNHDPKIAAVARSISDKLLELRSFPDSHQRLLPSKPPRLQFYTSDPVAPPTTNHELFKNTVPQPFYYEHKVRAPFTVGYQYRSTDNTTVIA
ncbi:hypothetical protein NCS56_01512200 [Fusarium sp. Ph1]|nr:hypothetical protein NCS56_01512200 [Fusarium sp. Ph1]